jgi:hypothetical protein
MLDDAGHILHIDFGFCFDIAPGGVKFERAPFKLTSEMVAVMGGSIDHQAFKWFEELCVKAFLASRQYTEKLSQLVLLMMDSGLPCFKPESVQHFKDRFVLDKTEREAADFMKGLVKRSYSSYSTAVYDQISRTKSATPISCRWARMKNPQLAPTSQITLQMTNNRSHEAKLSSFQRYAEHIIIVNMLVERAHLTLPQSTLSFDTLCIT